MLAHIFVVSGLALLVATAVTEVITFRERVERERRRRSETERLSEVYALVLAGTAKPKVRAAFPPDLPAVVRPERDHDLVEGSEAFLTGRYREHLESRGEPLPAWAWVNRLAHGTVADIEALCVPGPTSGPEAVVASIGAPVVLGIRSGTISLESAQLGMLIPLEDHLLHHAPQASTGDGVAELLVAAVHAVIPRTDPG